MALTDINFSEGEPQDYLLELGAGTLHAPLDILSEEDTGQYPVAEVPALGRIFVISE